MPGPDSTAASILSAFQTAPRRDKMNHVLDRRVRGIALVLENLYDPHNISATLRSAEALGIQDVHVIETGHRFRLSSGVTRGCEKWLTLRRYESVAACAAWLTENGYEICVADHRPGTPAAETHDPLCKRAWWLGSEHLGVSEEARGCAGASFRIPMGGFSESFNVSVAVALTLYAARSSWERVTGLTGDLTAAEREELHTLWLKRDIASADAILARHESTPQPIGNLP